MTTTKIFRSWGKLRSIRAQAHTPAWIPSQLPENGPLLAYGMGRSYGDSCLLDGGSMIETRFLDRIQHFDPQTGILRAEPGISLSSILRICVPKGWFLPTTPGTSQITLGGAIANDIHGKNHHRAGCFGNHVRMLELLRSDGTLQTCRPGDPMFAATIGGLGLTGFITSAEIQLAPIRSAHLDVELIRFCGLDEFMEISAASTDTWEHTVSWIDCVSSGKSLGRGIFIRGNWSDQGDLVSHRTARLTAPIEMPGFTLNRYSVKAFNALYYRRFLGKKKTLKQHYSPFFYPLDSINEWNRIYGKPGFYQYQCVIPTAAGTEPMKEILAKIADSGQASFLAVLKTFGDIPSPGMLSFPQPGITLALDFPERGTATRDLFLQIDEIVRACKGRLYPAKDARMDAQDFIKSYPQLESFKSFIDPKFSSDFWKRMTSTSPKP
jgi:FAD/FMN-containing dehydrogenase